MKKSTNGEIVELTETILKQKNASLTEDLEETLEANKMDIERLRNKLTITFWVIIILSVIIFSIGIVLVSVPVVAAFSGEIDRLNSLIAAGFGIIDLVGLVLYGPIEKIHKLMGDMSQIIMVLNCNQTQISLRLLEMDFLGDRPSVGRASENIGTGTQNNVKLIQEYFETAKEKN